MYQGSFEQCLTRGAQRMRDNPMRLVLIWRGGEDGIWRVEDFPKGKDAAMKVALHESDKFIALDYGGMASFLRWVGDNVLHGSN